MRRQCGSIKQIFTRTEGSFLKQNGKYKRYWLLNNENLRLQASMWVRENSYKKGEPNMMAQVVLAMDNDHLLPSQDLPPD